MDSILQIIRQVVRDELRALHIGEVGTVTSVFPIADPASPDNYACSVKLRDRDVELRKVPMATPHVGMVSCPQIGDLVLVTFIGGNANDPVVIGRLHSERMRPPIHEDGELAFEAPYGGKTRMSMKPDGAVVISVGDAVWQIDAEGNVSLQGESLAVTVEGDVSLTTKGNVTVDADGDANITVDGNCTLETVDCAIKASGNIDLGENGGGVITDRTHKCYFTGAPLVGSGTVTAKG